MAATVYRLPNLIEQIGLSRATIYKMVKAGTFPKPIKLGVRAVGWLETDIDEWLEQRELLTQEEA